MRADIVGKKIPETKSELEFSAADLIVSYLEQLGVDYVFGIPGGAIEPLYNALARSERRGGVKAVTARHESGAAFMAEGYARNSGKLGVCCSTTGPGATNMITGVASAYENNTPMLVITPQTVLSKFGRKAMQESGDTGVNVVGMYQFCTRYNTLVTHQGQVEQKVISAITSALRPPYGPSHLSIPSDILKASLPEGTVVHDLTEVLKRPHLQDEQAITELCNLLIGSRKVAFVLGVDSKHAAGLVAEVARMIDAPILATPDGKSFISPYHPLFRGVIGFAGHKSAISVLQDPEVEATVVVGASLGEFTSNAWDKSTLMNNRLIHVESNAANFERSPMAKLHVLGDLDAIFEKVAEFICEHKKNASRAKAVERVEDKRGAPDQDIIPFILDEPEKAKDRSSPLKPQWLMSTLPRIFPFNTRYLADTGNNLAWSIHYLNPFDRRLTQRRDVSRWQNDGRRVQRNGLFQVCAEFCSMGWSVGNAIGASLANPGEPILCIIGDGSFLMFGNEITVALEMKLPIVFMILNDSELGMVKHGQLLNNSESIAHKIPHVNFAKLAESMGIAGYRIESAEELLSIDFQAIYQTGDPVVLDVIVDPNEVPPIATRITGMN